MRYAVVTFGCRVNQADSLRLIDDLRQRGGVEAPPSDADLVVVNSCSVTASADQGTRQTIRRIARDNPHARIVVTGCYATREPASLAALPNVLRVIPNSGKDDLVAALADEAWVDTATRFGDGDGPCGARIEPGAAGRTAFTLRVQTGCDEACSYCIIPSTRGPGRSLPPATVVREVERIAAAGYREIALAGVHLGSYGRDLSPASTLVGLLEAVERSAADAVFRISSLEPMDCPDALIDLVAASRGRFAPHFHLPLQHASDRVLRRMRRPYTLAGYAAVAERIRTVMPHASIGTDVIAGFPGESDQDFEITCEYLASSPLSHLHVFPYSERPGTAAPALDGRVPPPIVRARALRLREIGARLTARFRAAQLGTVRPGLAIEDGTLVVTDNYLKVRIAPGVARNTRVRVRVESAGGTMTGSVVAADQAWSSAASC